MTNDIKKPKTKGFLKSLRIYYYKYWVIFLTAVLSTLITSLVMVAIPKIVNILLDKKDYSLKVITTYCTIILILIIILGIFSYVKRYYGTLLARKIEIDYRKKVMNNLLNLDMNYFQVNKSGEILTKVINDTSIVAENAQEIPLAILSSIITFIGSIIVMMFIEWRLTLVIVGLTLFVLIVAGIAFKLLRKSIYNFKKIYTSINGQVIDRLNAIRLIKANGTEQYEAQNLEQLHQKYFIAGKQSARRESLTLSIFITIMSSFNVIAIIAGIIFIGLGWIKSDEIEIKLVPFIMSINILVFPILQVINVLGKWATGTVSIQRLQEILSQKSKIQLVNKPKITNKISGNIIFDNITFGYDENIILKDFNFTFENGKTYAVVGETGVGKSTISKLLLRYYDPQAGKILINDNLDLKNLDLKSYLSRVGYIEQEPEIFYGDFFDNIKYGCFDATKSEVIEAAKKANLHDYIMSLNTGYTTIVGERGFVLSGGQKQRILIARIFLKNPDLLVLDEATSALDNIVEQEIQIELNKLMKGRTTIIIAHRLSTIKNVDKILVLEKNKGITQVGNFNELINTNGRFKLLYEAGLMEK